MAAYTDARIVDAIIALVAVEALILLSWRALADGGLPVVGALANLSSGAALLLALRMALTGTPFVTVLAVLSAALVAHVVDLATRWESALPRFPTRARPQPLNAGFVLNGRADRLKAVEDLANQGVKDHRCGSPSRSTIQ